MDRPAYSGYACVVPSLLVVLPCYRSDMTYVSLHAADLLPLDISLPRRGWPATSCLHIIDDNTLRHTTVATVTTAARVGLFPGAVEMGANGASGKQTAVAAKAAGGKEQRPLISRRLAGSAKAARARGPRARGLGRVARGGKSEAHECIKSWNYLCPNATPRAFPVTAPHGATAPAAPLREIRQTGWN